MEKCFSNMADNIRERKSKGNIVYIKLEFFQFQLK